MKTKAFFFLLSLMLCTGFAGTGCSYHNDDNPNEYPDQPEPEPEPEPDPEPEGNKKYIAATRQPNCYMVKPGETVAIPLLKAYAMWNMHANELGYDDFGSATPEPVLVWQDQPDLIKNVGLIPGTKAEDGSLTVSTANKVGNAVVGIRIGKEIRWSWHLWVTRYDPDTNPTTYGKTYTWDNNGDGIADYVLMDRNLGATNTEAIIGNTLADSLAACGLFYQWGRKDPFPGDSKFSHTNGTNYNYFDSKPIYDINGTLLTEGSQNGGTGIRSIYTDADAEHNGLWKAITSPTTLLLGKNSFFDWTEEKTDTLWNGKQGKTPFDPCPKGWRVPVNKNDKFVWEKLYEATTNYSPIGVIPFTGFRYRSGGGCLKNSGFQACIWTGNMVSGNSRNVYVLEVYISPSENKPVSKKDINCPSDGCAVRCVRE